MKIITTDEEIARFVAINVIATISRFDPQNRMTGEHLIGMKNAVKSDISLSFKRINETFETLVNDSLNRKS
jgi:hypothetical protein